MIRFRYSLLFVLGLCCSCSVVQSQQSGVPAVTGTRFDVDINGRFTVVDAEKNVLRQFSKDFVLQKEVGGPGWNDGQFDRPAGVWARNGIDVFVADYGNHRIQRFDRNLAFVSSFSTRDRPNQDERFGYPTDVAVSRLGDLYICDSENSRILKVVGLSKVERTFGGFDAGLGRLRKPDQLEVGPHDNVYVQDGSRIVEFDNFGNFIRILGDGLFAGRVMIFADEDGLVALDSVKLLCFDRDDRVSLSLPIASLLPAEAPAVRAFVFSRGVAYFLTPGGIMATADPRSSQLEN